MKGKRIISMCICLLMVFSCLPTSYANADRPSISDIVDKTVNLIGSIANSEDERVQGLYDIAMYSAKGEVDPVTGDPWNTDELIGYLKRTMANQPAMTQEYLDKLNDKLSAEDEITIDEAIKLVDVLKIMDIFTVAERVQILEDMKDYKVPEIIKGDECEDLVAKIREDLPELESKLESQSDENNSNFDLELYIYGLTVIKEKIGEPVVIEDKSGDISIYIPDSINGIDVEGIMDEVLEGFTLWGYQYDSLDQLSNDFVKVINERLTDDEKYTLKVILAEFDLYEGDMVKPVITLEGDETVKINQGETYTDEGVTAEDNVDGDITSKVEDTIVKDGKVVDVVDTNVPGTYTIKYNVTDKAGNEADEVIRTVIVIKVVEIDEEDIEEEEVDGVTEITVTVPDVEVDEEGTTEPVVAQIPLSDNVKEDLGLTGDQEIEINLPALDIGVGEELTIAIKKAPESISADKKVLAVEIEVKGLDHNTTVTLVLPIPQGVNNPTAFHRTGSRWEIREGSKDGNEFKFDTNLSSVAIADKVEVPTLKSTSKSSSSVTLEWTSTLTGATYEVYKNGKRVTTTSSKTYTATKLEAKTQYDFKVRALDKDNFESEFSSEISVTTDKKYTSSGGGGGGGGGSAKIKVDGCNIESSNGDIDAKSMNEALDSAIEDKKGAVNIKVTTDSTDMEVNLPKEGMKKLLENKLDLNIKSEKLEYNIPAGAISEKIIDSLGEEGQLQFKSKELSVSKTLYKIPLGSEYDRDNALVIDFVLNGLDKEDKVVDNVSKFNKSIDIKIDLKEVKGSVEKLNLYYVNEKTNKLEYVPSKIVDGNLVVKLNHYSMYSIMEYNVTYSDIQNHWSKEFVETMASKYIVKGYEDGTFKPDNKVTRAEFATLLVKTLGLEEVKYDGEFTDISKDDWYANMVATAAKNNLVGGYEDDTYKPNKTITRAEMAVMIANALEGEVESSVEAKLDKVFNDTLSIPKWARPYVLKAYEADILVGADGSFNADNNATRGEATTAVYKLFKK
ncbi:S-layer homology domain-containing protein [Anaeromicrobium sediminis]|uniref:Fibronectin type-III domain-containing protein n=1 Tax=Anaeromicrobium sediminis TaxID=1478221 RepID=A0A267MIP0_9FIRM|nr:S-layer homology domain-containing protein [Anaeromicrobium sediminis]PAB59396.1 hypothetical protein CCE28_11105 [Anaeromicrobium sediminis]